MVIFVALVGCHDILILGKSPREWRQHPDMTIAVDWDVKHQFKLTKKVAEVLMLENCGSFIFKQNDSLLDLFLPLKKLSESMSIKYYEYLLTAQMLNLLVNSL